VITLFGDFLKPEANIKRTKMLFLFYFLLHVHTYLDLHTCTRINYDASTT